MRLQLEVALSIIDQILLTNLGQQIREVQGGSKIYSIGDFGDQRVARDVVALDISVLTIGIGHDL